MVRKINLTSAELDTLRRFAGRFDPTVAQGDEDQTVEIEVVEPDELQELARRIFDTQSKRQRYFPPCMFGEPAWEMLLALYAQEADGKRLSVSQLTSFSESPPTTALRWLEYLESENFVVRVRHPSDGRSHYIEMSDKARTAMEQYLTEILKSRR